LGRGIAYARLLSERQGQVMVYRKFAALPLWSNHGASQAPLRLSVKLSLYASRESASRERDSGIGPYASWFDLRGGLGAGLMIVDRSDLFSFIHMKESNVNPNVGETLPYQFIPFSFPYIIFGSPGVIPSPDVALRLGFSSV
jgi:hypothetical protein